MEVIQTETQVVEVIKNITSIDVVNKTTAVVEIAGGVRGSDVTVQNRTFASISSNTTAGTDATQDYWYACTAPLTLILPSPVGRTNAYHVEAQTGTVTIASTSIEDSTSLDIYTNESVDLFPVNGMWRVF